MLTPGPWTYDDKSGWVVSDNCCQRGPMHVADIRGWGHLTGQGHGAHAMKWDEAVVIQKANAAVIASAPDFYEAAMVMACAEDGGGDAWWRGFEMLKAALKKAGGEFPSMHQP